MIIEWTKKNIKVIPVTEGSVNIDKVILCPGNNEVDKDLWAGARKNVLDQIKTGVIVEQHTKVEEVNKTPKAKQGEKQPEKVIETKLTAKELKKLTLDEAEEIVVNTFNLDTLKKWKKKENRDSIRALIMEQIETVEKHGTEKKKG